MIRPAVQQYALFSLGICWMWGFAATKIPHDDSAIDEGLERMNEHTDNSEYIIE